MIARSGLLVRGVGLLVGLLFGLSCSSAPHDAVTRVPIGSQLSELDRYLERGGESTGEVVEFVPVGRPGRVADGLVSNEFGTFKPKHLGSYDKWKATMNERDRFTGEITFIQHGSTSSDVSTLFYQNGKLRKRDWGFLPG